ncbi:MAG: TIR domain-containing protein [Anaerolineales bacterium]|nr:MAG: TIR domain-containing protein [Anaerolineales bacterium]
MAKQPEGANGSVFISYSRKDKKFVKKLNDALDNEGVKAWVDWEGIELASDWRARIADAIQSSDAFIFVISPDSLKSKVCGEELAQGIQYNKKLIPVLYRPRTPGQKVPKELSQKNYVYMRAEDNFRATLPKLVEAINTDLAWVQLHTKVLNDAIEWDTKNRSRGFLLQSEELKEAETWMANASTQTNRIVLPLQAEFIHASRSLADRRQRIAFFGVTFLLVLSLILSVLAFMARNEARASQKVAQTNESLALQREQEASIAQAAAEANEALAEQQTNLAKAQRSAALAQIYQSRPGELDTSALLALDSWDRSPSFEAEDLIRSNVSLFPLPVAHMKQDGPIFNIEWSPDRQFFVTGNKSDKTSKSAKNLACVWREDSGEKVYCVEHDDDVTDALFSPDGQYLITASADKSVRFWNAANGEFVQRLDFGGAVLDLDESRTILAIGRQDNYLTLYYFNRPDLKPFDYEVVNKVNNIKQPVGVDAVQFSPSGGYLAFGTTTGTVKMWQISSSSIYNGPKHTGSDFHALAFSPDSLWLVSGGSDSFSRLTKRDGTVMDSIPHGDWVEDVAFGPDSSWYVTVSDDNKVRVINTESGAEKLRMSHSSFVQKVAVSPDGQWIASTGYDKLVRIWDSVSGSLMLEFPLNGNGSALSFNQDGRRIVAADESGTIAIWDTSSLYARLNAVEFTDTLHKALFAPSGEFLLVNADDYNVWEISAGDITTLRNGAQNKSILQTRSLTYDMAISPDSNWVAVVENDNVNPRLNRAFLASMDGQVQLPLEHGGEVTSVGFTNDGKYTLTAGVNGLITAWEAGSSTRSFDLDNEGPVLSLAASPTTGIVAVGLRNKVNVWDTQTKQLVTEIPVAGNIVTLTFSKDGQWLAVGSANGAVSLWKVEAATFTPSGADMQFSGTLNSLAFSPNNQWLAGGDSTGFAYLWDVAAAQELSRLRNGDPVTSVTFSPDGSQLITVARKVVRVWDLSAIQPYSKEELQAFACKHFTSNLSQNTWTSLFGTEPYHPICPDLPEKTQ